MIQDIPSEKSEESPGGNIDSRILPVMREAVTLVQMIFFGELKKDLENRHNELSGQEKKWLTGSVVNSLFGTVNNDPQLSAFAGKHRETIEDELRSIKDKFPELLPHLTDALRMQTLCDETDGVNSVPTLLMARELGVLQEEKSLPMPSTFMIGVRKLGVKFGVVSQLNAEQTSIQ